MSVLALLLPPRERLAARAAPAESAAGLRVPTDWNYVLSADGRSVTQAGSAPTVLLPKAGRVALVLAEADVAWHRVAVPKAPAARLRAALVGTMEDALLDDDEALHFALADGTVPGQTGWVAVTHRPRLRAALAALDGAGITVERVVAQHHPAATLEEPARGHFFSPDGAVATAPWLTLARGDGVVCLHLAGALARSLQPDAAAARWTATPAAAAAAERWLGAPVTVLTDAERALQAVAQGTNLRQFDLVPRHRGTRALGAALQRLASPEWRLVRWGAAALVAVQLVGLNAHAWQQRQALGDKRAAMEALLKSTYPGVRTVLDAPLQMQRETERLRAAAGRPGDADLEAMLGAAAAAWPDGQGALQGLAFESGRLTLQATGFGEPQLTQFRQRLAPGGLAAELAEGRIVVTRATPGAGGRT